MRAIIVRLVTPPEGVPWIRGSTHERLNADATFDVWSFGTVLFDLMARQPLFSASSDDSLEPFELDRLAKWDLGDLSGAIDTLQATLRTIDDRMLVLAVASRYRGCTFAVCPPYSCRKIHWKEVEMQDMGNGKARFQVRPVGGGVLNETAALD